MSFISLWSAIASALLMPVSPPNAAHTQILPHHSQPTIAAEPIALPMTASRPDFIIADQPAKRSEEHTSELQSLMRISYAVFCLKKKNKIYKTRYHYNMRLSTKQV